jgi:hypothetical protein
MLEKAMINMTGVAELLVGFSTTKYVLQQTADPNMAPQTSDSGPEGQADSLTSPKTYPTYLPAVEVNAGHESSEGAQHNGAAGRHALAVVGRPAETASIGR